MQSKIAAALHMKTEPVAVYRTAVRPEGALMFKPGVWGCVIAMLGAAAKGRTAAFDRETVVCRGGRVGLGFEKFAPGAIEYFLSTGETGGKPGEHYKASPELARAYVDGLPDIVTPDMVVFQPLSQVTDETPETVVFLVNADQLSALVTLANYDKASQDNVQMLFGAGCAQSILYGLNASKQGMDTCYIGLTDPSARKCIDKDVLSFTVPYARFLEMEANADGSFLHTDTWQVIERRL